MRRSFLEEPWGSRRLAVEALLEPAAKDILEQAIVKSRAGELDLPSLITGIELARNLSAVADESGEDNAVSLALARCWNAMMVLHKGEDYDRAFDDAKDEKLRAQWIADGCPDDDEEEAEGEAG